METANNIIKNKIDSVTDLPEGYVPNLNSKWELLQAGLPQQPEKKERKPVLFYIQRVAAVAAMLLMIGGSSLLLIKKTNTAKPQAQVTPTSTQPTEKIQPVLTNTKPLEMAQVKSAQISPKPTKTSQQPIIIDSVQQVPSPIINPEPTPEPMLAQAVPMPVITEVDFTEPVLQSTTPTDVLVKAQRFKFKLGIGETQGLNATTNKPSSIGLRTSF